MKFGELTHRTYNGVIVEKGPAYLGFIHMKIIAFSKQNQQNMNQRVSYSIVYTFISRLNFQMLRFKFKASFDR